MSYIRLYLVIIGITSWYILILVTKLGYVSHMVLPEVAWKSLKKQCSQSFLGQIIVQC